MSGGQQELFLGGEIWNADNDKMRIRSFLKFDLSSIPHTATITSAVLNIYYDKSMGDNVYNVAPNTAIGSLIIDHIDNYDEYLPEYTYETWSMDSNIGTMIPMGAVPSSWFSLSVIDEVQYDFDHQDYPNNTSCFRLRQSSEQSYLSCTKNNYWSTNGGSPAPYLKVKYAQV